MSAISPVVGLLPIIVEWKRTGVFAWSFERTTPAPSDIPVTVCSAMLAGIVLLLYYAIPLVRLRPSPGACVLGYQVLPEAGGYLTLRRALTREHLSVLLLSAVPSHHSLAASAKKACSGSTICFALARSG